MKSDLPGTEIAMRIVVGLATAFILAFITVSLMGHAGGIASTGSETGPAFSSRNMSAWLRNFADDYLAAKAFNRMKLDARRDDQTDIARQVQTLTELRRYGAGLIQVKNVAEILVTGGERATAVGMMTSGEQRKEQYAEAGEYYRDALKFDPEFHSDNPELLNSLGYFLADQGENMSDYRLAESLLRRARSLDDGQMQSAIGPERSIIGYNSAICASDSLAWALFKEGKLPEARAVEENAFKDIDEYAPLVAAPAIDPEVVFHLAEIYRGLGLTEQARKRYQQALSLHPDSDLTARIQVGLHDLGPVSPAHSAPKTVVKT